MGQLLSTYHSKPLKILGYFQLALLQSEVAFFIGSKNSRKQSLCYFLSAKSKLECPSNVPFHHFSNQNSLFYLGKSNLSQGICNPLLSIFAGFGILLHFLKEVNSMTHKGNK